MRPLALHISALSDSEYDLYTASFRDLALDGSSEPGHDGSSSITGGRGGEDAYFERISVGVRELRGWLRGRYAHVQTADIDGILRLFSPTLSSTATLTGAEFFAALRLVVHAENGRDVERSLAFVQANPGASAGAASVRPLYRSAPASPDKRHSELPLPQQPPPPMPSRRFESGIALPPPASTPAASSSRTSHNPFAASDLSVANISVSGQQPPPLHPSQRSESGRSVTSQSHPTHSPHNPFTQARSSRSDDGSGSALNPNTIPPLPPRKAAPPVPPPRIPSSRRGERSLSPSKPLLTPHPLLSNTTPSLIHPHPQATTAPFAPFNPPSTSIHTPPTIPPKPPHHVTSTLMKQSLHASKVAQSMKRAEEELERERVMSVLKRSSHGPGTGTTSTATHGAGLPPPPPAHPPHPPQYAYAPRRTGASPHRPGASASYDASSASSASGSVERERERTAPPLPRRRNTHSQHPSPSMSAVSAGSMEKVALAGRGGRDVDYDRDRDRDRDREHERGMDGDTRKGMGWDRERDWARDRESERAREGDWDGQRGRGVEQSPFKSPTYPVSGDHGYYAGSPLHSPSRSRQQSPQRPHANTNSSANGIGAEAPPMHPDRKPYLGGYQAPSTSAHAANEKSEFDRVYGVSDRTFAGSTSAGGGGGERERENEWDNTGDRERDRDRDRTRPSSGESSPTMRVFRSKSMHYTSSNSLTGGAQPPVPQQAPPPPMRRKRPESVQVLGSGGGGVGSLVQAFNAAGSNSNDGGGLGRYHAGLGLGVGGGVDGMGSGIGKGTGKGVTRRSSLSVSTTPTSDPSSPFYSGADGQDYDYAQQSPTRLGSSNNTYMHSNLSAHNSNSNPNANPLSSLHRTLTSLQPKFESLNMSIQPKLDKARYKAEAGIARRGFIPASHARGGAHGGGFGGEGEKEGLMHDDYGGEGWRNRDRDRERSGRGMRGSEDSVGMGMDMDAGGPDVDSPLSSPSDDENPRMRGVGDGIGARGMERERVGGDGGTGRGVEKDNLKWPVGPGEGWRPL